MERQSRRLFLLVLSLKHLNRRLVHHFDHVQFQFLGIKFCFGDLVDCELLDLIHVEVGSLQESIRLFAKDSKVDKVCILKTLNQ